MPKALMTVLCGGDTSRGQGISKRVRVGGRVLLPSKRRARTRPSTGKTSPGGSEKAQLRETSFLSVARSGSTPAKAAGGRFYSPRACGASLL